jgi:hypothetical protein
MGIFNLNISVMSLGVSYNNLFGQIKMHIRQMIFITSIFFFMLPNLYAEDCPLKGKWKSNSELTLKGAKNNKTLSQDRLEYLSKEVFGKLVVEFTCNSFITYAEDRNVKTDYKIIKQERHFITIEYFDEALGKPVQDTLELIGGCFIALL